MAVSASSCLSCTDISWVGKCIYPVTVPLHLPSAHMMLVRIISGFIFSLKSISCGSKFALIVHHMLRSLILFRAYWCMDFFFLFVLFTGTIVLSLGPCWKSSKIVLLTGQLIYLYFALHQSFWMDIDDDPTLAHGLQQIFKKIHFPEPKKCFHMGYKLQQLELSLSVITLTARGGRRGFYTAGLNSQK